MFSVHISLSISIWASVCLPHNRLHWCHRSPLISIAQPKFGPSSACNTIVVRHRTPSCTERKSRHLPVVTTDVISQS
ncbi:hypothetical protein L2E82_49306 [Cichorium intybus]|uniref:Uncharacterized protein n=1 Tax=Cichorium intybus TaxID=13427 RepID=A0ACB8Z1I9_CICIN|nr:hypothetical protein L2E82_49306 [Cichorium intybus]